MSIRDEWQRDVEIANSQKRDMNLFIPDIATKQRN